jgi:ATP-dependent RNA helicase DeaD
LSVEFLKLVRFSLFQGEVKMTFRELSVKEEIVRALTEMGIEEPTKIQMTAIPMIKSGKDVIGMSKTGSGKTAAFGVPIVENIMPGKGPQVLIMTPVRELAAQIAQELEKFSKYMRCSVATVFGGVALGPQVEQMAKSEIMRQTRWLIWASSRM